MKSARFSLLPRFVYFLVLGTCVNVGVAGDGNARPIVYDMDGSRTNSRLLVRDVRFGESERICWLGVESIHRRSPDGYFDHLFAEMEADENGEEIAPWEMVYSPISREGLSARAWTTTGRFLADSPRSEPMGEGGEGAITHPSFGSSRIEVQFKELNELVFSRPVLLRLSMAIPGTSDVLVSPPVLLEPGKSFNRIPMRVGDLTRIDLYMLGTPELKFDEDGLREDKSFITAVETSESPDQKSAQVRVQYRSPEDKERTERYLSRFERWGLLREAGAEVDEEASNDNKYGMAYLARYRYDLDGYRTGLCLAAEKVILDQKERTCRIAVSMTNVSDQPIPIRFDEAARHYAVRVWTPKGELVIGSRIPEPDLVPAGEDQGLTLHPGERRLMGEVRFNELDCLVFKQPVLVQLFRYFEGNLNVLVSPPILIEPGDGVIDLSEPEKVEGSPKATPEPAAPGTDKPAVTEASPVGE